MHGFNIIIHEHQKKEIEKRVKLNYYEELQKKFLAKENFSKIIIKELNLLVDHLDFDGVHFYGFKIDMLDLEINDPQLWYKVHSNVEYYISDIGTRIQLIEFCYISIELNDKKEFINSNFDLKDSIITLKNELPYLNGIIGVRTLIGQNDFLDFEVKKVFRDIYEVHNIEINRLYDIKTIKYYWNFIIKQNNFRFHRFTKYSDSYNYMDYYGTISDLELIYSEDNESPGFAFGFDEWRFSNTSKIRGIQLKNPNPIMLVIYLLNLYFSYKNYKISENSIFEKIKNTKYSFNFIGSIDFIKNNSIKIFEDLKFIYPMHLNEIHKLQLVCLNWNNSIDFIKNNNQYLSTIIFNKNAIEFRNGVFFLNENKFYSFSKKSFELSNKMQNYNIVLYIDKNYRKSKKTI